ncbi:hypothetical protein GALMADRAFT_148209 [Galerina marginata CBS 339.88]|uniref:Uncharacterized protein n=1 Tax=Galerina marginata (strain CBS 339.88) TaxID=685588 RepID=A0A067S5D8_GALM3|nr:hypothetical protein GALMADRAFT_148209 [Galerina marginata CBS 339.88]
MRSSATRERASSSKPKPKARVTQSVKTFPQPPKRGVDANVDPESFSSKVEGHRTPPDIEMRAATLAPIPTPTSTSQASQFPPATLSQFVFVSPRAISSCPSFPLPPLSHVPRTSFPPFLSSFPLLRNQPTHHRLASPSPSPSTADPARDTTPTAILQAHTRPNQQHRQHEHHQYQEHI